ncbi:MAG: hypothetical protein WCK90_00555 [archaeon]
MSNIEQGDHVVCIDDKFKPQVAELYTALPKEGFSYVVREVRLGIRADCKTGDLSLLLVGLVNPKADSRSKLERGFSETRFRKLDELKDKTRQSKTEPETVADAVGQELVEV